MNTGKVIALTKRMIKKELSDLGPYHYVGTVADVNELPLTANVGDVYNVGDTSDGNNYAWNGTTWDSLGGNSSSILSTSEPYQQVYNLQVTGSSTQQQMIITDEDLGGQYKDIFIYCFTPQAPVRTITGDASDYLMHLSFLKTRTFSSFSDIFFNFPYDLIDQNDYLNPFIFVYHFINDGGLLFGKYGKTKLSNPVVDLPVLKNSLIDILPFSMSVDETSVPKSIFITPSLPINTQLKIYARNKI